MNNKKIYLVLGIILLCTLTTRADNYFVPNQTWSYLVTDLCSGDVPRTFVWQQTTSDSIRINGIAYLLLDSVPIRQSGQQIYAHSEGEDVLIYDFGLKVGDKIIANYVTNPTDDYATVTAVDSVWLSDGRKTKRIQYDHRATDIEYIGSVSNAGVLSPLFGDVILPCGGQEFLCCSIDGQPIYEVSAGSCDKATPLPATQQKPIASKRLINGQLFVEIDGAIYDVLGRNLGTRNIP